MMKRILTLLLLFFALKANAQLLTFSSELGYFGNDENMATIKQVWEGYINAVAKGGDTSPFWGQDSLDILYETHKDRLLNTYNIRKLTDEIYEINTIAYYPDEAIKGGLINTIYKVCAMQTHEGWRLMNYFDAEKCRQADIRTRKPRSTLRWRQSAPDGRRLGNRIENGVCEKMNCLAKCNISTKETIRILQNYTK